MPIDGPPISSHAREMPITKQTITRIATPFDRAGVTGLLPIRSTPKINWMMNTTAWPTRNSASRPVAQRSLPHPDERQQRRRHEQQANDRHHQRRRPDAAVRYQGEQRDHQGIDESGQRRVGAYPEHLRRGLGLGEPLAGDRDSHEEQPDQRAGHPGAPEEEVVQVLLEPSDDLPMADLGRDPTVSLT